MALRIALMVKHALERFLDCGKGKMMVKTDALKKADKDGYLLLDVPFEANKARKGFTAGSGGGDQKEFGGAGYEF
jgi:hypothetical protein